MSPPARDRRKEAPGVHAPREPQARLDELHEALGPLPPADLPIALLPVRLETRFVPAGTQVHFCVRVYPDDLHVETHEPELLGIELIHGRHAWEQIWRGSEDEARRKAAWAQLAQRFGPPRAAWILRATRPANPEDRPAAPISDEQPLPSAPRFSDVPLHEEAWTRAPAVRTLPDRWVVFGYREGQRALVTWGEQIPPELAAGPSPAGPEQDVPEDQLPLDSGMRWLVDFDEAVRVGMGVRIQLASAEAARGYDDLLVVGVKSSQDGAAGALRLAALLDSQHYTDGLAFVPQGTPTNNTPGAPSGFRSQDAGFEESYGAEIGGAAAGDGLDNANVSARALGIPGAAFSQIAGARDREQADARAMHTALWPATWGYFLEQVLDEAHAFENVSATRRLFIDHVRGRGPLPALRVGRQPYGILPASSLDRWKTAEAEPARTALVAVLRALRARWRTAMARVPRIGRTDDAGGVEGDLLELLATEPVTSGFRARPVVDAVMFGTPALPPLASALPPHIVQRRQAAQAALSELGVTWPIRALDFVFLGNAPPLTGPLVQSGTVDVRTMLAPDYVRWLIAAETDFARIRDEVYAPELAPPGEKLDSLLFLLLRHSALLTFADVAHRILKSDNVASATRRAEPSLIGVLDSNGPRPLDELEKKEAPSLGGARPADQIHSLTAADHPAAAELDEFRAALAHLSGRTVAELERLLPEALDCCAHRLDAWITAIAAERLAQMRDARSEGVLIGGYGWVQHVRPDTSRTSVPAPPGEEGPLMRDAESGGFIHAPSLNQAATAAVLRSGYLANRTSGPDQPFAIDLSSERTRRARWLLDGVRQGQPLTALLGYRFERGLHENHPGLELDRFIEEFRKLAPLGEIYQARGEKEDAAANETAHREEAQTKRDQAEQLKNRASQELERRQNSRARVDSDLRAAERDVSRFEEEIRKLQRPVFPPDPDRERRLAALRAALKTAQSRVASSKAQLPTLDKQIAAAEKAKAQAVTAARQLTNEARRLEELAADENRRKLEASAREQDLLARRRAALLLPHGSGIESQESIAVENVVDGLSLQKRYRKALEPASGPRWDEDTIPFGKVRPGKVPLPADHTAEFRAIVEELAILDSSIDAVSDAVTAESVHQAMLGNPMRAGATLNAVAGGETPPPELEAIRTPRTGTAVTYRMAAVLPEPAAGGAWPTDDLQARAVVEPRLNAWAALLLGDPRRVRGLAEYVVGDAVAGTREFSLETLALSPLDLLWMAGLDAGSPASGVLDQRLRYELLRNRPDGVPADAAVRLNLGRTDAWGIEILSVNEVMIVARTVSALIASSRTMDPRDLEPSESAGAADIDFHDLGARVDGLVAAFEAAHARLETLLNSSTASAEQLREILFPLTYFDVDAVPVNAQDDSTSARQALLDQAIAVRDETAKRAGQLRQAIAGVDRAQLGPTDRLELENARVAIVLGKTFRVVPRFALRNAAELNPTLAAADALLGGDRLAPLTWIQRMARVRSGVARLSDVLTYSQSINPGVEPDLRVLQLPHEAIDRWAALPLVAAQQPPRATLSVVLQVPHGFPQSLPPDITGLMIDEWVEVTPNASEQSGLAFHFDAPGSRPPQAILLAVPPDKQPDWNVETLETIVIETLELAKLRMVTSADLDDQVSQFLPALFFGLNLEKDTVSTDFRRAAAVPQS